jgi:hypothetical protein
MDNFSGIFRTRDKLDSSQNFSHLLGNAANWVECTYESVTRSFFCCFRPCSVSGERRDFSGSVDGVIAEDMTLASGVMSLLTAWYCFRTECGSY